MFWELQGSRVIPEVYLDNSLFVNRFGMTPNPSFLDLGFFDGVHLSFVNSENLGSGWMHTNDMLSFVFLIELK